MKKGLILAGIGLFFLLAGCNQETRRDIFTDNLELYGATSEHNHIDFIFAVEQLERKTPEDNDLADDEAQEMLDELASLITTRAIGEFLYDKEKDAMQGDMTIIALANEIPIEFIRWEDKFFLAGASYLELLELASQVTDEEINQTLLEERLANRYLEFDLAELAEMTGSAETASLFEPSTELANERVKLFADYSDTLDEDSFIQAGDAISRNYSLEELENFGTYVEENGSESLKEQMPVASQLAATGMRALTITVDPNIGKLEYKGTIDNERLNMVFSLNYEARQTSKTVEVPSGDKVIAEEEKMEILARVE